MWSFGQGCFIFCIIKVSYRAYYYSFCLHFFSIFQWNRLTKSQLLSARLKPFSRVMFNCYCSNVVRSTVVCPSVWLPYVIVGDNFESVNLLYLHIKNLFRGLSLTFTCSHVGLPNILRNRLITCCKIITHYWTIKMIIVYIIIMHFA